MEDFLEVNRVLEISLSKLANRSGDLPLRKTLLVSQVLNRAEVMATSVQDCLLQSPYKSSNRCTSKLLASFGYNNIDELPASQHRTVKPFSRQSPIAMPMESLDVHVASQSDDDGPSPEEPMDFNVTSFLGNIIDTDNNDETHIPNLGQKVLKDISNVGTGSEAIRPVSPVKRNYQQAFQFDSQSSAQGNIEDLKRFKSCILDSSQLDTLPGFCGTLSLKNLQTAPFITYMFGRGFTHPSNPNSNKCDWPISRTHNLTSELITPLRSSPILAF